MSNTTRRLHITVTDNETGELVARFDHYDDAKVFAEAVTSNPQDSRTLRITDIKGHINTFVADGIALQY